jgi:PilZ domain-containing protein
MSNQPVRNGVEQTGALGGSARVADQDRRLAPRIMLVASVEAEELTNGISLSARTADISVHGCYLDTINPFSPATRIRVHLTKGNETFHSLAVVTYAHQGMGMGIAFMEISPEGREIIQGWIAELESGKAPLAPSGPAQNPAAANPEDGRAPFPVERLIQILVKKGVLTQEEVRRIVS